MLKVNFPRVSKLCSCFPDSTPYTTILPRCEPVATILESGEKQTDQDSTGPASIVFRRPPVPRSQSRMVESSELEAATGG